MEKVNEEKLLTLPTEGESLLTKDLCIAYGAKSVCEHRYVTASHQE